MNKEHTNTGRRPSLIAFIAMLVVGVWGLVAPTTAMAQSVWQLKATDNYGAPYKGIIQVDANGFVTAADVTGKGLTNGYGPNTADDHYTAAGWNTGSGFAMTSDTANGIPYYYDNLWIALNGSLTSPVGTVLTVLPNGGGFGDPNGSLRYDIYGDPFNLSGTMIRLTGANGAPGAPGAVGPMGPAGADGAQGPAGPTGAAGANGAQGPAGATGAQGPAGPASTIWELNATDGQGGALQGVIEVNENGVVTAADVSDLHTVNAYGATFGDVRYMAVNGGLPNTGSSFGLSSSSANGIPWGFDNLWFVLGGGSMTQAMPVGTVLTVSSGGGGLGDPHGSTRADYWGDNLGITGGTLTRIIRGRPGTAGATGANGAQGPAGPAGANGGQGPAGAAGAAGPIGPAGPVGPAGPTGPSGPAGANGAQGPMGLTGATGSQGTSDLPSGTVIFLMEGTPAPAGWTLLGGGMEFNPPQGGNGPGRRLIRLDVYRKN